MCKHSGIVIVFLWAVTVFALFPCQMAFAEAPDTLWTKTYGGTDYEEGSSVRQTSDGGYIIVGWTRSFGAGEDDIYLIKTDADGDILWTKTFGTDSVEHGHSVQQTDDGGYIIVGETKINGNYDVYLIKTDADGGAIWTKIYQRAGTDEGYSVQQTSDGGYIIAGNTSSGPSFFNMFFIKTDANGDTIWTKTYGGGFLRYCYSVQQTIPDGGYIATGIAQSMGECPKVCLIKLDTEGGNTWTKFYGTADYYDVAYSVQQTSDTGYIISGYTQSTEFDYDVYLIKTDSLGNLLWSKVYGGIADEEGHSVRQTSDGGYIIAGYTKSFGSGSKDVYLIKTDADGDTLWTKTVGGSSGDEANSVQQTTDGGYIIAGTTSSFGFRGSDIYLIKTEPDGVGIEEETSKVSFALHSEPNPFRDRVTIRWRIEDGRWKSEDISLRIYDATGRLVKEFILPTASTAISWDGRDDSGRKVGSGVYFVRLETGNQKFTRKVLLLR